MGVHNCIQIARHTRDLRRLVAYTLIRAGCLVPSGVQLSSKEQLRSVPKIRGTRPNRSACAADKSPAPTLPPGPLSLLCARVLESTPVWRVGGTPCCFSTMLCWAQASKSLKQPCPRLISVIGRASRHRPSSARVSQATLHEKTKRNDSNSVASSFKWKMRRCYIMYLGQFVSGKLAHCERGFFL